jgi:Major Facilitator Superfamily
MRSRKLPYAFAAAVTALRPQCAALTRCSCPSSVSASASASASAFVPARLPAATDTVLQPIPWRRLRRVTTTAAAGKSSEGLHASEGVPERVRVVLLCFVAFVICNCDRINLSVAILPMAKELGWSQSLVGVIQGSFYVGYVTTQLPSGYLSDKYGGRNVLAFGVVAWSLMTLLTPWAASTGSLPTLLAARILLGVGEGVGASSCSSICNSGSSSSSTYMPSSLLVLTVRTFVMSMRVILASKPCRR